MTNEQLQNGAKLAVKIGALEAQLEGWKRATRFTYDNVTLYSKGTTGVLTKSKRRILILML